LPAGFEFSIGDSSGGTTAVVTDGDGIAFLNGIPAGATSISEQIPDGYAAPRVFCRLLGVGAPIEEIGVDVATV
jgi:hypothetical protein